MMGGRGEVYTGDQVQEELCRNNLGFSKLDFIQSAQWMQHPGVTPSKLN